MHRYRACREYALASHRIAIESLEGLSQAGAVLPLFGTSISVFPDALLRLFTFAAFVKPYAKAPQEIPLIPRCQSVSHCKINGLLISLFFHQFKANPAIRPKAEVYPRLFNTVIHRLCG